jgi:hypothetical protein
MTIKQQGGIFGRNPTFNDVDVEGTLTVDGNAVPDASTILVDSDIGVTVQLYDAATAKTNVSQTFTTLQNFNFAGGGNFVAIFENTSTSTPYTVNIGETSGPANGYPLFRVGQSYSPFTDYFRVDSQGKVYASGGVHIGGAAAANELDDYEEGTWTPTLANNGTVTYSNQFGRYTKIGNSITVWFDVACSNYSGGSSDLRIGGLPYTTNIEGNFGFGGSLIRSIGVNLSSGYTSASLIANSTGGSHFTVYELGDNVSSAALNYSALATTGAISGTVTYRTS